MYDIIQAKNKNWVRRMFINFHLRYSHFTRIEILGKIFVEIIKSDNNCTAKFEALDFGCGDMRILYTIQQVIPTIIWTGCDIHNRQVSEKNHFNYVRYDGLKLPFATNQFKIVLLSDVLHHIVIKEQLTVLKDCLRVGEKVLIKDSFEKGYLSRFILIMMDILGNWGYGVRIPNRYFTKTKFLEMCKENDIDCKIEIETIELYNHLPSFIKLVSPPDLHFIAVLKKIDTPIKN